MPTPAQEISITYGSLLTGGSSAYTIDSGPALAQKPSADGSAFVSSVSWVVFVQDDDRAAFEAKCAAIVAAFSERFQDLTVEIGGQTFISWSHGSNTGFNADPGWSEIPDSANTGFSRRYTLGVAVELPATDNDDLREASATISHDSSDKITVTFRGVYTASEGGGGALANYESKAPGYCTGILSGIGGGPYELVEQEPTRMDQDKECPWVRVYEEIIFPQKPGSVDDSAIVRHNVVFSRQTPGPGDTPGGNYSVKRLTVATASYACNVEHTETKSLEDLWRNTLRQYVFNEAKKRFKATIVAVTVDDLSTNASANTITASLSLVMIVQGSTAFEYSVSQTYSEDQGAVIRRVHDGKRYSKYVYPGPADTVRTTVIRAVVNSIEALGKVQSYPVLAEGARTIDGGRGTFPGDSGWVEIAPRTETKTPVMIGLPGIGTRIPSTLVEITIVETWVLKPGGATGSASQALDAVAKSKKPATLPGGAITPGSR
ncbi:MAG: hypothetical protein DRH30_00925 [Deltaproteobacteria bacterium]|nr:MAG: hypothetical protein DRH30_00925 [Deltaproteobacteria bacterium]